MSSNDGLSGYIEGIAKASFCRPKREQRYISLAHFLSLQPRECMKVKDEHYPDMMVGSVREIFGRPDDTRIAYIWLPTPPKKSSDQNKYVEKCRRRMMTLVGSQFDEVLLDVRGNIGGVLSTVIDAIYPMLAKRLEGVYLHGIDNVGKRVATFEFLNYHDGKIIHLIRPSEAYIPADILPVEPELADIFDNKPINILCNRYTMSTGEIICIVVRKIGGKIYGEKTRGLTNGMEIISGDRATRVFVPYYSIADGDHIYRDGVEPDGKYY